jgi:hypothetical protein
MRQIPAFAAATPGRSSTAVRDVEPTGEDVVEHPPIATTPSTSPKKRPREDSDSPSRSDDAVREVLQRFCAKLSREEFDAVRWKDVKQLLEERLQKPCTAEVKLSAHRVLRELRPAA